MILTVQNLPFSDNSPLLQGDQRQQAEKQNVHKIASHKGRETEIAAKRPHLYAKRHRDHIIAKTR